MRLGSFLVGAALMPAIAAAEAPRRVIEADAGPASLYDVVVTPPNADGYQLGRQLVPPAAPSSSTAPAPDGGPAALALSRTVYLNKNGVTLSPGTSDSRSNRSTLVTQQTTIPAWNVSAEKWAATVKCVREIFAPFNINVVETDPGNVPHIEAVFGGSPTQLGMASTLAGVSPFTSDCAVIENSIVFTFTANLPADPIFACEVQAQEIGHSYGLDHVVLASDPMTYAPYDRRRWFQNRQAQCGEDQVRPCGLNGSVCSQTQNSVAMLTARVGLKGQAGDTVAPTVNVTSPANGQLVPPRFEVSVNATDNARVSMVTLYVDGVPSGTVAQPPYAIRTPYALGVGMHQLRIVATDGINERAKELTVTVSKDLPEDDESESGVIGACTAGGGAGGAGAGLLAALAVLGARPRRRRGRRHG